MFKLNFETGNAAFDEWDAEIPRILRDIADKVERGEYLTRAPIRDINGNTIGEWGLDFQQ